jgi:hypothetical protein
VFFGTNFATSEAGGLGHSWLPQSMFVAASRAELGSPGTNAAGTVFLTCQTQADTCTFYDATGDLLYMLTASDGLAGPEGLSVGSVTGTWAIANANAGNVLLYSLTQSGPVQIGSIDDVVQQVQQTPFDVKISEVGTKKGQLESQAFLISNADGNVLYVDSKNDQTVLQPLSGFTRYAGGGVAFDAKNKDCYWEVGVGRGVYPNELSGGYFLEYKGCQNPAKVVAASVYYGQQPPLVTGLALDAKGHDYFNDSSTGAVLTECQKSFKVNCKYFNYSASDPTFMALSADVSTLYLANASDVVACGVASLQCQNLFAVAGGGNGIAVFPAPPP